MLNEFDKHHFKLMKNRILSFEENVMNLDSLVSITRSIEETLNALKNVDHQLKEDLTTEWWELELLSSVMLAEEEEEEVQEPLDAESKQNIYNALENMKKMIDAALDNRQYFPPEK